ncbi:hypothetical protein [Kitasatospora camelliae]|uniref:Uncharacterized protein n=1 Tax=Kitasatospora camelliae TaxID=3156397 RepID=A0AAU8K453_9ACTN
MRRSATALRRHIRGRLFENGGLLPHPHATLAGPTYEQWLTATS